MTVDAENEIRRSFKKQAFYHVLVWSIFIGYELLSIAATVGLDGHYLHYIIYYGLYICLFYFNAHIILSFSFLRSNQPYLIATVLILLEILISITLKAFLDLALQGHNGSGLASILVNRAYLLSNVFRLVFFIGFSIAYWSLLNLDRLRDQNRQLEIEELKQRNLNLELTNQYISLENAYLQNQVSPHILFNSLNFIYYAVYQLSDRAGKGIMLLSELLRYSLTVGNTKGQLVSLESEIKQVKNLIELDRMRFKDQRYLSYLQTGTLNDLTILPLALLTMVENMIKHGDCGDADHPAKAVLEVNRNYLSFSTVNKKRLTVHPSTGIGLMNLRKRLNNSYPDKYEFVIKENEEDFFADLKIYL